MWPSPVALGSVLRALEYRSAAPQHEHDLVAGLQRILSRGVLNSVDGPSVPGFVDLVPQKLVWGSGDHDSSAHEHLVRRGGTNLAQQDHDVFVLFGRRCRRQPDRGLQTPKVVGYDARDFCPLDAFVFTRRLVIG